MVDASSTLVADIGATHARFAIALPGTDRPVLSQLHRQRTAAYADLQQAIAAYLLQTGAKPAAAMLAVACPVPDAGEIRLTNHDWRFHRETLRDELGLRRVDVINDFGAVAHALPVLQADEMTCLHGDPEDALRGPVSVLGPGSGLGVALLLGNAAEGWQVVETEGGHAGFAPGDEDEMQIARVLSTAYGHVSKEHLLSGPGLARIDAVLRGQPVDCALRSPAVILANALAGGDPVARQSLERFCAILGSVAGDIALLHGARSVVLAGGIVPRFIPFLRDSAFRRRLRDKGRFAHWLDAVTLHVITHPEPGLLGAAVAAHAQPRRRSG